MERLHRAQRRRSARRRLDALGPSGGPRPLPRHPGDQLRGARGVLARLSPAPLRRRVPLDARQRRAALRRRRRGGRLRRQLRRHPRAEGARGIARRAHPAAAPRRAPPGSVPGDALARAAQPARADRQRRERAAHDRAHQPDPRPPARDPRAPGRPARSPDRGADRRHARGAGPDHARARAGLGREHRPGGGRGQPREADERGPPARGRRSRRAPVRARRPRPARAGAIAPDHERGEVHLPAEHRLDRRPARRQDGPDVGEGPGRGNRSAIPAPRFRAVRAAGPDACAHARRPRGRPDARAPDRPAAWRRRRRLQRRPRPGQRIRALAAA